MRVVFMGTPAFAVPALDAIVDAGHEVAAVYTRAPRPAGRGLASRPSPVAERAAARAVAIETPASLRDPAVLDRLTELAPQCVVVVAFGLLLPEAVLALPPRGCLNLHASLLPRWRGAAPRPRALHPRGTRPPCARTTGSLSWARA
jgi:methionyl-tRNA formyltransferase